MSLDAGRVGVRADQVDIHGRVISPSFLNELLEDLPEWTDMPVWVNGTEELLPSNNSVPVTSPILADIAYPDIRRDNQYFTYRESPTPVDGLAKIKSIKGNTIVWNQTLLSFNGTGLKTVGKNLLNPSLQKTSSTNAWYGAVEYGDTPDGSLFLPSGTYTFSFSDTATGLYVNDENNVRIAVGYNTSLVTFTLDKPQAVKLTMYKTGVSQEIIKSYSYQLEFGSTATDYEPYTSHTTNLPVSTYFPTGMKSARRAYDELTPTKASTRIGVVDLGSLVYVLDNGAFRSTSGIPNMIQPQASVIGNIVCPLYRATSQSAIYATANNMCVSCLSYTNNILVRNDSYTSASDFKTAMQGQYLYYELATPVELPTLSLGE